MAVKVWKTKEWKEQRASLIEGKSCEWCGSTEALSIHHTHETNRRYKQIERRVIRELIKEKVDSGEVITPKGDPTHLLFRCPECGVPGKEDLSEYYLRRTDIKDDSWIALVCPHCDTFIEVPLRWEYLECKPSYTLSRENFKTFCTLYKSEIEARIGFSKQDYLDLSKDIMILCKRCHYALHKGKKLCPVCKSRYVSRRYSVCFKCLSPQQKQEIEEYQERRWQTIEWLDADELLDDETYHSSPDKCKIVRGGSGA